MRLYGAAALGALLGALACRGDDKGASRDAVASAVRAPSGSAGAAAAGSGCPPTGHWTPCQVRKRLEQSGVAPRDTTLASLGELPQLGPAPIALEVGTAGLAVYLFADSMARHSAAATIDTALYVAPGRDLTMASKGTAIASDNLLALHFSRRDQQRERVADALLAGPPQP